MKFKKLKKFKKLTKRQFLLAFFIVVALLAVGKRLFMASGDTHPPTPITHHPTPNTQHLSPNNAGVGHPM